MLTLFMDLHINFGRLKKHNAMRHKGSVLILCILLILHSKLEKLSRCTLAGSSTWFALASLYNQLT